MGLSIVPWIASSLEGVNPETNQDTWISNSQYPYEFFSLHLKTVKSEERHKTNQKISFQKLAHGVTSSMCHGGMNAAVKRSAVGLQHAFRHQPDTAHAQFPPQSYYNPPFKQTIKTMKTAILSQTANIDTARPSQTKSQSIKCHRETPYACYVSVYCPTDTIQCEAMSKSFHKSGRTNRC